MTKPNPETPKKRSGSDKDDFEAMRKYILDCPLFTHPHEASAVKAALAGLDKEWQQRERDAKLQKKFAQSSSLQTTSATAAEATGAAGSNHSPLGDGDEWHQVNTASSDFPTNLHNDDNNNKNQYDANDEVEIIDNDEDSSYLGKQLAEVSIASIAEAHALVRSPLAALAVAIHAAMRSDILGFRCTGVTDDTSSKRTNGFAPPVRELPKDVFLPRDYDKEALNKDTGVVTLRYRKSGTGSVLLKVELVELSSSTEKEVSVKLIPGKTQEPPSQPLVFPLSKHINLDSFASAQRSSSGTFGIAPALHYKGLSTLLTSFAKTFDLGAVSEDAGHEQSYVPPVTQVLRPAHDANPRSTGFAPPIITGPIRGVYDERNPTIDTAFPQRPMFVGDFSGDLNGPGFPNDPLRVPNAGGMGNMMGPNHPIFQQGGGISGMGGSSGFGMRPRFDPFGPPGGPQEIHPPDTGPNPTGGPRHRPPKGGEPNPDHLPPPTSLGNNGMFS